MLEALEGWLSSSGAALPNAPRSQPKPRGSPPEIADSYRLAGPLRERLAAHLELDPGAVRAAGVTVELAEKAVSGQDLAPEIVDKLRIFLTEPTPAPAR